MNEDHFHNHTFSLHVQHKSDSNDSLFAKGTVLRLRNLLGGFMANVYSLLRFKHEAVQCAGV